MQKGVALVTGASRGIGRSIAHRLSRDGFRVVLGDHPREVGPVNVVREEIRRTGGEASVSLADVSVEKEVIRMVNDTVREGGLDVMVANAGICIIKPFLSTTSEELNQILSVNVMGTYLCYKYAAQQMIAQGRGGRIIGASSITGKQGWPLLSLYSASKFAIRGLTQVVAKEVAGHGITVNAYAPGGVDTSMMDNMGDVLKAVLPNKDEFDKAVAATRPPVGRNATTEEVAHLASFLASKEASMITGQTVECTRISDVSLEGEY